MNIDIRALRKRGHSKRPLVIVGGNGVTEPVINETDRALTDHELIKIRVNAVDRGARAQMIQRLADACAATVIQKIGHIAVLYREARDEDCAKPKKTQSQPKRKPKKHGARGRT